MIGIIGGLTNLIVGYGRGVVSKLFGRADLGPEIGDPSSLLGIRFSIANALSHIVSGIVFGTMVTVLLVLMLMILRRRSLAAGAFFALQLTALVLAISGDWWALPGITFVALFLTFIAVRYGLLAFVALQVIVAALFTAPHISASWSAPMTVIPYAAIALLALWAFRTSLGGQSVLAEGVLGD